MSEKERKDDLVTFRLCPTDALELVKENPTTNPRNRYFQRELIVVLNELDKQ